ncbi:c-type cytochrome [Salinicola avicenniae]|uniref:c-type cytochrome n=1 Tax=Salinicola avicenniae TaxID=2916836 RepID=UPI002073F04D|nr:MULTISPECIES: c-type cytochrome [unclassified Salinicola]
MHKPLLTLTTTTLLALAAVQAQADNGQTVYDDNCAGCHSGGGAPQLGDQEAWQSRIDKGMDALYANAINGVGGMPAKGGNMGLSDAEVKSAVDYLVDESR